MPDVNQRTTRETRRCKAGRVKTGRIQTQTERNSGGGLRGFVGAFHQAGLAARSLVFVNNAALGGLVYGLACETNRFDGSSRIGRVHGQLQCAPS